MSIYQICLKRKVILINGRKMSNQQILKILKHKERRPKQIFKMSKYKFHDFSIQILGAFEAFIELKIRTNTEKIILCKTDAIALAKHFKLTEQHLRCEKK